MKTAVLMTCFNRREKTMRCLENLMKSPRNFDVYLVEDHCTDGTAEAVREAFPAVHIIHGAGNLFWNRGMHCAWEHACRGNYDYYLWLNDDVIVFPGCFDEMFECAKIAGPLSIISGLVKSPSGNEVTYGGTDPETGKLLFPDGSLQKIRNLNGNVVLVPRTVVEKIGILDPFYQHHFGDVDYGYLAEENGIAVLTSRCFVGKCEENALNRIRYSGRSLAGRLKILYSPLGTPPASAYHFQKKHFGGLRALVFVIYLHVINLMPDPLYQVCFVRNRKPCPSREK